MAQIKEEQLEIPELNPFENCKLGREVYADNLTEIINTYSNGFVLAIDNKWGAGKTTFIRMWEAKLRNSEYKTVYFNSWENDLEVDPFVGIMAELKKIGVGEPTFEDLVLKAGEISTKALPILLKGVISKFIGDGSLKEMLELISEESSGFLKGQIDSYSNRKESISEFKNQLAEFVKHISDAKPLVYFIDELDRCRPDYAVLVLEKIKHLFSVPGIVFVLSIDKEQLCNSIKGFYGSDKIDSVEYLKRFIDIEYILPQPQIENYCNFQFVKYSFSDFFHSETRSKYLALSNDSKDFIEFAINLSINKKLSLRSIDKLFSHSYLVVNQFANNQFFFAQTVFWLIYIRMSDKNFFEKIVNQEYNPQEFVEKTEPYFISMTNEENERWMLRSFVRLVSSYVNQFKEVNPNFKLKNKEDNTLNISLKKYDANTFLEFLKFMDSEDCWDIKINFFLDKINLFENFKN
jgi:hypothetical protein